ncbi:MAG TPA: ribulose-phosphate 3-epimerase [Thermoanaerobaculaceae bacterium]|nr:ribulose-phosphate 3-epimerase [Thermoanaerobaculaceae bacterium]
MSRVRIAPSLLACDLARVADEVRSVEAAGADLIHFDVMDGHFVPNLTFGPGLCSAVSRITSLPLDVHLMVTDADSLVEPFARGGASRIAVHVEAVTHLHRTVELIRANGATPGVALNPATPVWALDEAWPLVGFVLVMSVNPGFGGQRFIPGVLEKLGRLAAERNRRAPGVELVVDGGVDTANAHSLRQLGANVLVAGTAVFGEEDRARALARLRGEERA